MDDDFDVGAAVDEVSSGLGLDLPENKDDDLDLKVEPPNTPPADDGKSDVPSTELKTDAAPAPASEAPPASAPAIPDDAPRTWRKEAAALWAGLPSEAKNEILKREADMFKGIEQYKEGATYASNFRQAISQYEPILRANNMDPIQTAANLFAAHHALATSAPERKIELLRALAADYNIDLAQAAIYEPPYVDPAVATLQQQLASVQSRLADSDRQLRQRATEVVSREVNSFAEKNPYFDEVADTVSQLITSGTSATLQDAYDKAVWMNPLTRAKEIARQTTETTQKAQQAQAERVTNAKQATAANVKTRVKSGSTAAPSGTLDDTLAKTLSEIRSRA